MKRKKTGWIVFLVIFLCVLIAGGIAYYFNQTAVNDWFKNTFTKQKEPSTETQVKLTINTQNL